MIGNDSVKSSHSKKAHSFQANITARMLPTSDRIIIKASFPHAIPEIK